MGASGLARQDQPMVDNSVVNDGQRERRPPSRSNGFRGSDRPRYRMDRGGLARDTRLAGILLLLAAMGVIFAPVDLYDRWQARTLASDGECVSAEQVVTAVGA